MVDGAFRRITLAAIVLVATSCSDDANERAADGSGANGGDSGTAASAGNGAGGSATGGAGAGGTTGGALGSGGAGNGGSVGGSGASGGSTSGGTSGAGGTPGGAGGQVGSGGSGGSAGTAGAGGTAGTNGGSAGATGGVGGSGATGSLPPVTSVDMDGPFTVTVDQNAGANSWVFRPTEIGKDGVKHPIFVWGTGGGSVPSQYTFHLSRMASHGFVAISPNNSNVTAAMLKAALDWILAENDKSGGVYHQKLNVSKIGMGGHSIGSVGTFNQEATETRLTTTIHIAGGSLDGMGSSKVKTPTAYICGQTDFALSNCQRDFQNVRTQPTFFSELQGIDHVGAARAALPGMVAWLRLYLAGEVERKAMFTGPSGQYFTGIWKSQTKNW